MTDAKLGRCPRCKAYGLVAERAGIRIALDIAPADAIAFGVAVALGQDLYWVQKPPGRPVSVSGRYSGTPGPSWGPAGSQNGVQRVHTEHGCGSPARDMVIMAVTSPKGSAPATPGNPEAGNLLQRALAAVAGAPATPSPAAPATHRPSDAILGRCDICGGPVRQEQPHWSITHGHLWIDGAHEECP